MRSFESAGFFHSRIAHSKSSDGRLAVAVDLAELELAYGPFNASYTSTVGIGNNCASLHVNLRVLVNAVSSTKARTDTCLRSWPSDSATNRLARFTEVLWRRVSG